ncbi:MAG: hypothetical protein JNM12_12205 [Alphaproteobacteria bacterium]|nr:hypothetical protein [Alphaproteobacteria bacterium]
MAEKLPERQKIPVNVIIARRTPQPDSRRFYSLNRQNAAGKAVRPHLKHPENTVNNGFWRHPEEHRRHPNGARCRAVRRYNHGRQHPRKCVRTLVTAAPQQLGSPVDMLKNTLLVQSDALQI